MEYIYYKLESFSQALSNIVKVSFVIYDPDNFKARFFLYIIDFYYNVRSSKCLFKWEKKIISEVLQRISDYKNILMWALQKRATHFDCTWCIINRKEKVTNTWKKILTAVHNSLYFCLSLQSCILFDRLFWHIFCNNCQNFMYWNTCFFCI